MKIFLKIFLLLSVLPASAATIDFGTTNKITFRCHVEIFEKKINLLTYKAYPGALLNTVVHEQYNSVTGPDIQKLAEMPDGRALFSNVVISGDGYFKWSVVETDDHALHLDGARWPISARVIYSPRAFDQARNRRTIGESDNHLYRIECEKLKPVESE